MLYIKKSLNGYSVITDLIENFAGAIGFSTDYQTAKKEYNQIKKDYAAKIALQESGHKWPLETVSYLIWKCGRCGEIINYANILGCNVSKCKGNS